MALVLTIASFAPVQCPTVGAAGAARARRLRMIERRMNRFLRDQCGRSNREGDFCRCDRRRDCKAIDHREYSSVWEDR
jgi:hypothetical protein